MLIKKQRIKDKLLVIQSNPNLHKYNITKYFFTFSKNASEFDQLF